MDQSQRIILDDCSTAAAVEDLRFSIFAIRGNLQSAFPINIFYDKFILDQGHKKSSNFYKACYDVGIGRSIILLLKNI